MRSRIFYKESVEKDCRAIDHSQRDRIRAKIERELAENPRAGKRLKGAYGDLFSLRAGDYRVIYTLIPAGILILRVAHRREVYKLL
ncbi:MAG: hypothetical protein A2636_03295 [Elusimicrobia bacterium RIFCSPHIGHO2_01_FULL_64_10]|nr:MAG: hypothetical protein A2636_03295 [Elusimicrobia bacterium RIFCSPHIGHO2_01_FULL_64_10]